MCEIVVRVVAKSTPDDPKRAIRSARGDVIEVRDDGFPWGRSMNNPAWRFLRLTVDIASVQDLLAPVLDVDGRLVQRRGNRIDLAAILTVEAKWSSGRLNVLSAADTTLLLAARKPRLALTVIG